MSGQLDWLNDGAEASLDWSPRKVNVGWLLLLLLVPEVLEALAEELLLLAEACNIMKGTATRLPLPEAEEPELPEVAEVGVELLAPELPWLLSWTTANSTRPDCGLISTSFTVPMDVPDEPWICAPWICEARMAFWLP